MTEQMMTHTEYNEFLSHYDVTFISPRDELDKKFEQSYNKEMSKIDKNRVYGPIFGYAGENDWRCITLNPETGKAGTVARSDEL